jgi:hypothetical protein
MRWMAKVKKNDKMIINTKEISKVVKNMVLEKWYLLMEMNMMVSFRTTKFKDKVYTSGLMVRFIRETGNSLRCMGKEHISFQMEQNMMVFIIWENDMGKV